MRDTWRTNEGRRRREQGGWPTDPGRYGESSLGNCPERTKHGQTARHDVDDDQASTGAVMVLMVGCAKALPKYVDRGDHS